MNKALLAKLGWRLLHDNTSLWTKVMQSKYHVKDVHDQTWTIVKSNWSSTWKSVGMGIREVILPGLSWVSGNGRTIRFWKDKWLFGKPILEANAMVLPGNVMEMKARELWQTGTGWVTAQIEPYVLAKVMLRLAAVVLDEVTGANDRLSWGENLDGRFSVKSAYALLTKYDSPRQDMHKFFDRVWRVVAPERVRTFLWLVVNQAIMTNMERARRHLSETSLCLVCQGGEESIVHVLRDCPAIEGIWRRIVPIRRRRSFFSSSLLEWIYGNLGEEFEVEGSCWSTMFAMVLWWGWKWRCNDVFGTIGKCRDWVRFVKDLIRDVTVAQLKAADSTQKGLRVERLIAWSKPREGWVKRNTDGASHGNPGEATAARWTW